MRAAMSDLDRPAMREEILRELTPLLVDTFVAAEWGRLLVRVTQLVHDGPWVVEGLDVEELHGDEERVERAFGSDEARASLGALAAAVEALCALEDVDVHAVEGGTFAQTHDGRFVFLPGLVRTPSAAFDRRRDEVVAAHDRASDELRRKLDLAGSSLRADHEEGTFTFVRDGVTLAHGHHAIIGTFERVERTWAWGSQNPTLSAEARARSAALVDAINDRTLWEISTPRFTTDEATARALSALVWAEAGGAATFAIVREQGAIYLLLQSIDPG